MDCDFGVWTRRVCAATNEIRADASERYRGRKGNVRTIEDAAGNDYSNRFPRWRDRHHGLRLGHAHARLDKYVARGRSFDNRFNLRISSAQYVGTSRKTARGVRRP